MAKVNTICGSNIKMAKVKVGRVEKMIGWTFPYDGWIQCNTDGACVEGGAKTACSNVFRGCSGRWVKGFIRFLGSGSVIAYELWKDLYGDGDCLELWL